MAKSGTLSRNQKRAITALLTHRRVENAAEAAGISTRTLYRWLTDGAFQAALARQESVIISTATRHLCLIASEAIDVLHQAMVGDDASMPVKVRAANHVLSHLMRLRELDSIEQRLSRLEAIHETKRY